MNTIPPPVCLIHTTLDVPAEIYEAAGTLSLFFEKEGHQNWQFEGIADHRLIAKLQQEKRELWDECVAMRAAIRTTFDALEDAKEQLKPFTNHD